MAELSLRRLQWFAHVAKQRRVRSTEIMPTETSELRFRAGREQPTLMQILVQFGSHRDLQGSHIGGHIVYIYNVSAGERKFARANV
jgi:hypothetical protein